MRIVQPTIKDPNTLLYDETISLFIMKYFMAVIWPESMVVVVVISHHHYCYFGCIVSYWLFMLDSVKTNQKCILYILVSLVTHLQTDRHSMVFFYLFVSRSNSFNLMRRYSLFIIHFINCVSLSTTTTKIREKHSTVNNVTVLCQYLILRSLYCCVWELFFFHFVFCGDKSPYGCYNPFGKSISLSLSISPRILYLYKSQRLFRNFVLRCAFVLWNPTV